MKLRYRRGHLMNDGTTPRWYCDSCAYSSISPTVVEQHEETQHKALERQEPSNGSSSTRKTLDPPRNAANPRRPLNRGVSGEGDT